jgi:hypothetical protein
MVSMTSLLRHERKRLPDTRGVRPSSSARLLPQGYWARSVCFVVNRRPEQCRREAAYAYFDKTDSNHNSTQTIHLFTTNLSYNFTETGKTSISLNVNI